MNKTENENKQQESKYDERATCWVTDFSTSCFIQYVQCNILTD